MMVSLPINLAGHMFVLTCKSVYSIQQVFSLDLVMEVGSTIVK